jgi:hypothetical protein
VVGSGGWEPRAAVVERAAGVDGIWRLGGRNNLRLLRAWGILRNIWRRGS